MLKYIVYFLLFVIGVISLIIYNINKEIKIQQINQTIDNTYAVFDNIRLKIQKDSIKTAILLSKNQRLIDALENNDEDLGYEILSDITQSIKKNTNKLNMIQIITPDYEIFARSWDDTYAGMPIGDYRQDLDYFKTHKNIRSSIELGRVLTFKTTLPVYHGNIILGYIEVLDFFDPLSSFMKNIGIDFYILMDEKYLDIAILMRGNDSLGKYVMSTTNHNMLNINILNSIKLKTLTNGNIRYINKKYIWSNPMLNNNGKQLGIFVFVLNEKYLKFLGNVNDNAIYFLNKDRETLYNVKASRVYSKLIDELNLNDSELLKLKLIIEDKDQAFYEDVIKNKLRTKTKEELINMLLYKKQSIKLNGEIR